MFSTDTGVPLLLKFHLSLYNFKAKIWLNTSDVRTWILFLHNINHTILDDSEGFGSMFLSLPTTDSELGDPKSFTSFTYALSLEVIKMIDTSELCNNLPDGQLFDMDNCLRKFYVQQVGCLSPWEHRSSQTTYPLCQNSSQHEGIFFPCILNIISS